MRTAGSAPAHAAERLSCFSEPLVVFLSLADCTNSYGADLMINHQIASLPDGVLTRDLPVSGAALWIGGFALLTALGAQLEIPTQPVPLTLQTFFVLLAGGLLGPAQGALSMAVYLSLGLLGAPVFAGGGFGLVRLLGPTGGYLLSFPLAAALTGWLISRRQSFLWTLVAMFAGIALVFLVGVVHLNAVLLHNWERSLEAGVLIFSWWDVLKVVSAAAIVSAVRRRMHTD